MGAPAALRQPPWRSMKKFFKLPFTGDARVTDEDLIEGHDVEVGDCDEFDQEDLDMSDNGSQGDAATQEFDTTVGVLQEVLLDPTFAEVQADFCKRHCQSFQDDEENKLYYTDIFHEYQAVVKANLEQCLAAAIPSFSMERFIQVLSARQQEIMEEVLDLLMSFVDFQAFKDLMLAHKLDSGPQHMQVDAHQAIVHAEEQEDGDERPDLDCDLFVSSVKVQ